MNLEAALTALAQLSESDARAFAKRIVSTPVNMGAMSELSRYADSQGRRTIKSLNEKIAQLESTSDTELHKRLDRLEGALQRKQRDLELQFYARGRAREENLDATLLDGYQFEDEAQIDAKITALADAMEISKRDERTQLLKQSYVPRSGGDPGAGAPTAPRSLPSLEALGKMPVAALEGIR
jgi:hypothetical protein